MKSIIELEAERLEWSLKTFPEATWQSSLRKLEGEIKEVEAGCNENRGRKHLKEEFADCLKCLFDSAARMFPEDPILPIEIFKAFERKLEKNKNRVWKKNPDNSYSHVKS